jgi:diphthamide biosynthesis protein 7
MPAILDLKWCHVTIDNRSLLAVANAVGEVLIYSLSNASLIFVTKLQIGVIDCETLALSLDWSTGKLENEPSITVSDSQGRISVLRWTDSNLVKLMSWKAHDFEAWITAFDYWNTSIIYTGTYPKVLF